MVVVVAAGIFAVIALGAVGIRNLSDLSAERRRIPGAVVGTAGTEQETAIERWDRRLRATRWGGVVERQLALAGINHRPIVVVLITAALALLLSYILWSALAPVFGLLGVVAGFLGLRAYIQRAQDRRLEQFVQQMPELARVLANATNAGMSIATALGVADQELADPAGAELRRVSNALRFGTDMQTALDDMSERLPSREVAVLTSTLIVCARSGGSLVTSLRDIANTLEARKETRREIRTILAQPLATSYMIIAMGFGMLFLLNVIQPGSVEAMTGHIVGQIALVISGGLFAIGFILIRKMARFDL